MLKSLKLSHEQAQAVVAGAKRTTWRMYDEKYLAVGDVVQLIDKVDPDDDGTWTVIGEGVIESVLEKRVKDLTSKDYEIEGSYSKIDDVVTAFRSYYGPLVTAETPVKIIQFSFMEGQKPNANDVEPTTHITEVKLYTDGGSRGNPGPSALGFAIYDLNDKLLENGSKYLGITTNNQAEYQAVKAGLEACIKYTASTVEVYMDSQLVAHQMNGIYKIKNRELWPIHQAIKQICSQKFNKVTFTYIPRALNKEADAMVNEALDAFENSR